MVGEGLQRLLRLNVIRLRHTGSTLYYTVDLRDAIPTNMYSALLYCSGLVDMSCFNSVQSSQGLDLGIQTIYEILQDFRRVVGAHVT